MTKKLGIKIGSIIAFLYAGTPVKAVIHRTVDTIRYDASFNGIGPRVYNLPPPKSKQELLSELYQQKQAEAPEISSLLDQEQLLNSLRETPAAGTRLKGATTDKALQSLIRAHLNAGNITAAGDAQNSLGIQFTRQGDTSGAEILFTDALAGKLKGSEYPAAVVILHNLALLNRHTGNTAASSAYFSKAEEIARKLRDKTAQADATVGLAMEQARSKNYGEAERMIIRKAIPLYKSAHNRLGHIRAFSTLGTIYEMQQKYAQASWFYLQAKGLMDASDIRPEEKARIFFNLANVKQLTGDATLAILDYKAAENIARQNNLLTLQLEIQDALGNIYHETGDYTAAVLALNAYNDLKQQVISRYRNPGRLL